MTSEQQIIYITGRGGDASKGLGGYLKSLDPHRIGLSVNSDFLKLNFNKQVAVVAKLIHDFDSPRTFVVANSYGAYLCLHALIDAPSYMSRFLFISPVISSALNDQPMSYSRLPGSQCYNQAVSKKRITKPNLLAIYIGDSDPGYNPKLFEELRSSIGIDQLHVLKGQGHAVDKIVIQNIVHQFLNMEVL